MKNIDMRADFLTRVLLWLLVALGVLAPNLVCLRELVWSQEAKAMIDVERNKIRN